MDELFDSPPTLTKTKQTELLDEEAISDAQDNEAQAPLDNQEEGTCFCTFCGHRVNPDDDSTYKEVRSWVSGPKRDSAVLRQYTGRTACSQCIANLRAGIAHDQPELEELLNAEPSSGKVGNIITDVTPSYKIGYEDGRAGLATFHYVNGMNVREAADGFENGKAEFDAEWTSGSIARDGDCPESGDKVARKADEGSTQQ